MLIPSIDLMDGKAVQLRQGRDLVITAKEDPIDLARRFNRFGEVAVIDLDAAMGKGNNRELIKRICRVADVRAGGGIRNAEGAKELLRAGARKVILGTAATPELLSELHRDRVIVALDQIDGRVVEEGWTRASNDTVIDRADRLKPLCSGFLCTFVKNEGCMNGVDREHVKQLMKRIDHPLIVAGGVRDHDEAAALIRMGLDVQVGMALYTGALDPIEASIRSMNFKKTSRIPTVVQDEAGQVLMLAYSTETSLRQALDTGQGTYFSRSRNTLWTKGETSGNAQTLISCRFDCDRDTLLFKVDQTGDACHLDQYSCFGDRDFHMERLFRIVQQRRKVLPEDSYTTTLFTSREKLQRKIMEEAFEVTQASDRSDIIWEIADLLYFLGVLAVSRGIDWSEIEAELGGRHKD